uniref:UDP-3-O-(3-hydroxymyristoyl)glucosamine N-acyltransferase n=3 Tax=Helicobacteraceae TaxID=72293 RepID=UPI003A8BB76B
APNAVIGNGSKIGANCTIMSSVTIGENVKIGANCVLFPGVCIYNDCEIGDNVRIHANSVVGSDGFGYAHTKEGKHIKIYHNGKVVLENDVEVGANTTIDRAVFGQTRIKQGTKIDNLVQIGHNCNIGEYSIIVSQAGISGSTTTGRNVVLGGQSGSAGHLHIGDFTQIGARGAISKSLPAFGKFSGHPLLPIQDWLKLQALLKKMLKKK